MNKKTRSMMHVWRRRREESGKDAPETIPSDVLGSYTGTPIIPGSDEKPVQDADDL